MKFTKELITILTIQLTEVLGFSLILPFLPFYAETFGASPFTIGLILASFSLFQFISAPIMGKLSDHYGRKPLLIISQISTFAGFLILGFASSLWMIIASRIVDGLFGSNMTIAQAYLSDISSKKDRSRMFGLSGAVFGFGFLIGPALGGFLALQFGYGVPSFVAAGVSFITIITTVLFLRETVTSSKRKRETFKFRKCLHIIDIPSFKKYFSSPRTSSKLWQLFSFVLTHFVWVSTIALYAERQLGFGAWHIGFALTYVGVISILFRGVLLGRLIDRFAERPLKLFGASCIIIGLLISSFATAGWMFLLVLTFFSVGAGLLRPLLLGSISRTISKNEQGTIMGFTNSLGSLSCIIAPLIGGFCINHFIPGSVGLVAAVIMGLGLVLMIRDTRVNNHQKLLTSVPRA